MSSLSSGSLPSSKSLQEPELSNLLIKKPRTLTETCPVETTTQRLPLITGKPQKKKMRVKKSRESSSGSEENWLKPGISLPKLHTKEVSQSSFSRSEEVSNPMRCVDYNSVTFSKGLVPRSDMSHGDSVSKSLKCYLTAQEAESEEGTKVSPDAVGPSACDLLFRVPSSELNFDEYKVEEEPVEESHALQRWEYWLKEHKKLQNYLSRRLGRKKCDLQFQKAQNYRMMLEDKSLFLRAQIPVADKWRGHPFLWKPDIQLGGSDKFTNEESSPKYYAVKTKLEKGEVPDMEFIGIPMSIKKEKSLLCEDASHTHVNSHWEKLEYRQNRLRDIQEQTKTLKPHDIQMEELDIVGKKIPEKEKDEAEAFAPPENFPKIYVSTAETDDFCPKDLYVNPSSVFCLSIEGDELQYEIGNEYCQNAKRSEFDLEWEIDFGANPVGVLVERSLRVENKGTIAVKYKLLPRQFEKMHSLNSLQPKQHEPWFFFNKNSGIFLPGQIYYLKFYHYTERSGVRREFWHLKTEPPLSKKEDIGTIVLWAVSTDESLDSGIEAVDLYLKNQATRSIVSFILQVLIRRALNPLEGLRGIEYRSLFLEKELFEYQNPKHYYHSAIVKEFHRFFEQIPQKRQSEWDLSIASLVETIRMYVKGKEQDSILRQIAENAKKLFRPNRLLVKNIKKYRMTYEILCKMANFMEEDYEYLRSCLVQKKEEVKGPPSEFEGVEEEYSGFSLKSEEKGAEGEFGSNIPEILLEIKPINFLYFQTMFYLKVYQRISEAVENVVGALETSKLLEPWKEVDYKLAKPPREDRE